MPQVADIKTKKAASNKIAKVLSATEQTTALAKEARFKKDFENALTIEEARALSLKHVRSLRKEKNI
jgi:hypothetical protein